MPEPRSFAVVYCTPLRIGVLAVVDDEIARLRNMLKNAHERPRASRLKKLAALIAGKFGAREKGSGQPDEKQKTGKTAA